MKSHTVILFFLTLLLYSCQPSNSETETADEPISDNPMDNLPRVWQLKEYKIIDESGNLDESQKESLERRAKRDGYQLCFIPNKTGTSITGEIYEEYSWEFKIPEATIVMTKDGGTESILRKVKIEKGEKYWTLTAEENNIAVITMYSSSKLADQLEEEPFHPINNQWRVKAIAHEDEKALKTRLLNFVTHNKLLFKASIDNPKRSFTNSKSDGIIQVYQGGIGFIKESAIPTEWTYAFYDEYQAKEAYDYFKKYLNNKVMKKTAPKDWKPVNYQILKELEAKIQTDISKS